MRLVSGWPTPDLPPPHGRRRRPEPIGLVDGVEPDVGSFVVVCLNAQDVSISQVRVSR